LKNRTLEKLQGCATRKNPQPERLCHPPIGPLASQIWERDIWLPKNVAERAKAVVDFIKRGLFLLNPNSH
jgi:hypothetical protein